MSASLVWLITSAIALAIQSQPATQPSSAAAHEIRIPGTIIADQSVELYAKVSGYASALNVDIGSRVRKGDVLLKIDVPELHDELRSDQAQLAANRAKVQALTARARQAKAAIETARAEVARATADQQLREITTRRKEELREGSAISQQELDEATSQLKVTAAQLQIATAKLATAEAQTAAADADVRAAEADGAVAEANVARIRTLIGYETIAAPFDGVVTERFVDVGAFIRSAATGATGPVLSIAAVDRVRVVVEVPEFDAPRVRAGTPVDVFVHALAEEGQRGSIGAPASTANVKEAVPLRAVVSRTAGALRASTRSMRVEIDLDNRDGRLAPGMYAHVTFKPAQHPASRPAS